jgi:hypothetical protein
MATPLNKSSVTMLGQQRSLTSGALPLTDFNARSSYG